MKKYGKLAIAVIIALVFIGTFVFRDKRCRRAR